MSLYVISYDISSDRRRSKIAKTMEDYGVRVQYSVFECNLSKVKYSELYKKLLKLYDGASDGSIRIYPICERCAEKIITIGVIKPTPGVGGFDEVIIL